MAELNRQTRQKNHMVKKSVKNTEITRNKKGQFTAGNQEGNRSGRPKKELCIPNILRRILVENDTVDKKITKLEAILDKVVKMAIKGDRWAVGYLSDRTEGKALDRVELTEVKTFFDLDKLKGVEDADIRTVIKVLKKLRTESSD